MVKALFPAAVLACALVAGAVVADTYPSTVPDPLPVPVTVKAADGGVQVLQVDGTVNIGTAPRFDTNITNTYVPVAADSSGTRLAVEVANTPSVIVSGTPSVTIIGTPTFALPASTLSLLAGQRNCSYTPLGNPSIGAAPVALPRAASQTGISVTAHNFGTSVDYVVCWPETLDAGPLPNCANDGGVGYPIHAGGELALDLTSSHRVFCRTCTHGGGAPTQTADLGGGVTSCVP
jgi:hypothetical protein